METDVQPHAATNVPSLLFFAHLFDLCQIYLNVSK